MEEEEPNVIDSLLRVARANLETVEEIGFPLSSEADWFEFKQAMKVFHVCVEDALAYLPDGEAPELRSELQQMLDQANNLHIGGWLQLGVKIEHERHVARYKEHTEPAVCPAALGVAGIPNMADDRFLDFCINDCPYQDRCDSREPGEPS